MSTEELGDRIKSYENYEEQKIPSYKSFILRMDGNSFSKFTKGFKQPFDSLFVIAVVDTMNDLVKEMSGCRTGYCHSDEISLYFPAVCTKEDYNSDINKTEHPYNGKVSKLISLSAGLSSVRFNYHINNLVMAHKEDYKEDFINRIAQFNQKFDSRVVVFPEDRPEDVANYFVWRSVRDSYRNAVAGYARQYYSSQELHKKNSSDLVQMMLDKDFNFEKSVPIYLKHGVYCKRELYFKNITNRYKEEETCVRTRKLNRCFKIHYSDLLIKLLQDKYWSNDLQQYDTDIYDYSIKDNSIGVSLQKKLIK